MKKSLVCSVLLLISVLTFCQMTGGGISKKIVIVKEEYPGHFFVAAQTFGGKIGYMKTFGASLSAGVDLINREFSALLGISKSILRNNNIQWNLYPIVGLHNTYYYDSWDEDTYYEMGLALGGGTDFSYKHLYLNFDFYIDMEEYPHIMTGIGWRF